MRKGFGLLAVIFILLVFSVLGVGLVSLMVSESRLSIEEHRYSQAFYIADAGKNFALKHLSGFADWSQDLGLPLSRSFGGGVFTIDSAGESANALTLYATGVITREGRSYSRAVRAAVSNLGGGAVLVQNWREMY